MDTANMSGYWLIAIDGVDSPVISRFFGAVGNKGSIGVLFRSGLLGIGAHTIIAKHYTESGVILTSTNATLVAFALEDCGGNYFKNIYDTVASDTTVSAALEDIDGLTGTVVMDGTSHLFGAIATSAASSGANTSLTEAVSIAGEESINERGVGGVNRFGSISVVGRSIVQYSGNQIIKGRHSIAVGTGTTAPSILFGMELGSEEGYEIPSARSRSTSDSTSSGALADITNTTQVVLVKQTSHIISIMSFDASKTTAGEASFAISINGVDYETITRTFTNANDDGSVWVVAHTTNEVAPGTYTIVGRWSTTGGTLSVHTQANLVSLVMENDLPSSFSLSASLSPSLSPSISPSISPSRSPSTSPSVSPSTSPSAALAGPPGLSLIGIGP
jgi:hypothetical protein